jgi:hypothetical protein
MVEVGFRDGHRPPLHMGPFVMVQTETAAERTADRHEITLESERNIMFPSVRGRTGSTEILCNNFERLRYHRV